MKKAFSLLELIVAMVLMLFVGIYAMNMMAHTQKMSHENYHESLALIDLNSAYNIVYNRMINDETIDLKLNDKTLFLFNKVLLENVIQYSKSTNTINICVEDNVKICQTWKF